MRLILPALLLALAFASLAECYHILCIFGVPTKSHNHLGKALVNTLLNAGHEVTWVTPYPPKETRKGLTIIDGSATRPITERLDMSSSTNRNANLGLSFVREFAMNISRTLTSIPELRNAVTKSNFDAVVTETFFSDIDAGFAAILQVPWILLSPITLQPGLLAKVDEVSTLPIIPLVFNDAPIPMNLLQRFKNVAMHSLLSIYSWCHYQSEIDIYNELFQPLAEARGVPLPPLEETANNVSLVFVNSHNSFAPPHGLPPNVVEIGGFHIEETTPPLPKDLQELLDSSTQGVVYFSMGSIVQSAVLSDKTRNEILKVLGEIPYTVLWKFEEELKNLPGNVHVRSWMPQASILAHKNTKVFITHGGLLSTIEALRYGVPLITIPVFGDQPANAARAFRSGYALRIEYNHDTMPGDIKNALNEMLTNDKYYKQAKYLSYLFNNRPVSPSKLIPYYVELAIETKGAYHLKSKALEYAWYQRWMLDIGAILITILFIVYYILKKTVCFVYNKTKGCKKETKKENKKAKRH